MLSPSPSPRQHRSATPARFTRTGRAASLSLLRARIARLAGIAVLDDPHRGHRGAARLVLDVRATGLSGYEIGRRMRVFSGVPLEFCREDRLVIVFDEDQDIGDHSERLLFALGHAVSQGV